MNNISEKEGLIFYKRIPTYPNDKTKNCGLTGNEIDGNFNFLRGMDISEIGVEKNTGKLYLKRLNGDLIKIDNKGNEENIEDNIFTVKTTDKFIGDGSLNNPLDLSSLYMTNSFKSVKDLIDLTESGEYPNNPKKGDRYIIKEKSNDLGFYYSFEEVEKLDKQLKPTGWRIPTIKDWDKLLNSLEPCEEDKTHGKDNDINYDFEGKIAGKRVKSVDLWESNENDDLSDVEANDTELSILPLGGNITSIPSIDGLKEYSMLWSSTKLTIGDTENVACKKFTYNNSTVGQVSCPKSIKLPIRLVKDFTDDNFSTKEEILGNTVDVVLIDEAKQIWTKNNISFDGCDNILNCKLYNQIIKELPSLEGDAIKYYITEFDGDNWNRIRLVDGDKISIINENENSEYVLIGTELKPSSDLLESKFNERITNLENSVRGCVSSIEELKKSFNELKESIPDVSTLKTEITQLKQELDDFKSKAITSIRGTNNEIKVEMGDTSSSRIISFADNAMFIAE